MSGELHKCKYCGVMTTQPDENCYKATPDNTAGRHWKPGPDIVKADKDAPLWDASVEKEVTEKIEAILNDIAERNKKPATKRCFVNVYEDGWLRFISDLDYASFREAFDNRGLIESGTYIETVEILRISK